MRCPGCDLDSPERARFCAQCGTALGSVCPRCGGPLPAGGGACTRCPAALPDPAIEGDSATGAPAGDRRHLAVMFCDLVGSTELSIALDPEDLQDVLGAYVHHCTRVIERHGGHVAQVVGDGLLTLFGYPKAHGDDAERAVHAGLRILETVGDVTAALPRHRDLRLSVRIGIASGLTVVRGGRRDDEGPLVIGPAVNVAARLQHEAERGELVVSEETLGLLHGRFVSQDLGHRRLHGVPHPIGVHRILRALHARERAGAVPRAPLIGREQELALLLDRWHRARQLEGHVVLLAGEAGMGKSRLVNALRRRLDGHDHVWIECHGSAYHASSAFHPVADLLRVQLGVQLGELDASLGTLTRSIAEAGLPSDELVPDLAPLLDVAAPSARVPAGEASEAQRRRTLRALLRWLMAIARRRPAVVVVEDLHWIDPSTLELLTLAVAQLSSEPLLLLLTFRPEFQPPFADAPHVTSLRLPPLTRRQVTSLVEALTEGRELPPPLMRQVVARTDGVPLFVEELTKTVIESVEAGEALHDLVGTIPQTLSGSLTARLDRLGPAREVAQLAAVIGRSFSYALIETVAGRSPAALQRSLARLVHAELLVARGTPPDATYTFKHALIRDAAYSMLLRPQRTAYHARVAESLEATFSEQVAYEPELVARHWDEAGEAERAVGYYERAAARATTRSAYAEAVTHLERALALLASTPEGRERDRRELALHVAIGPPLIGIRGYGDAVVERTYARARELCCDAEDPRLAETIWGLANFYQARGDLQVAERLGEELVAIAGRGTDPQPSVWAHLQLGATHFWCGMYRQSLEHLERASSLYDRAGYWFLPGAPDPWVASRAYAGLVLWLLGRPDPALSLSRDALARASELGHPYSLGIALCFNGTLHQLRREPHAMLEPAEEVVELASEYGFPSWRGWGRLLGGWARAHAEAQQASIDEMRGGIAELAATGTALGAPAAFLQLAEALHAVGQAEEALRSVETGLALGAQTGQRAWDGELLRVRGDVRAGQGAVDEALGCYRRAIALSDAAECHGYALRAAIGEARLLEARGAKEEARALIEPRVRLFAGSLDTPDVAAARTLAGAR